MKTILDCLRSIIIRSINYNYQISNINIELQSTRKEYRGYITLVLFPLIKIIKKPLKQIGKEIGKFVKKHLIIVQYFYCLKGYLNFEISEDYYYLILKKISKEKFLLKFSEKNSLMIEYSSPNTNKPLHLGHIRNHLLGNSIYEILKAFGYNVIKIQIINDRGIHICKSILGWKKFSFGESPKIRSKGDHLIGKYYVAFDRAYKKEIEYLKTKGYEKEFTDKQVPIIQEIRKLLILWEYGDIKTLNLWKIMNKWVYEGFEQTYFTLGVNFDHTQYESKTYLLGKKILKQGLRRGIFFKKNDGSIWINFYLENLYEKLLLRSDRTSLYITQDLGTAVERFGLYSIKSLIYIVGEEQEYHFKVLFIILKYLGYKWVDGLFHLSYGLVNLTAGKMKSREGIIIDADNLIEEMYKLAQFITYIKKKKEQYSIGIGALKYHVLKIDMKKHILYDTKSSIDFNGNTGIYIQYAYSRISSLYRRAFLRKCIFFIRKYSIIGKYEKVLLKLMEQYINDLRIAKKHFIPSIIANLSYNLAKTFNDFYQNICIINSKKKYDFICRVLISKISGKILKNSMKLLGIYMQEQM